ITVIYTLSLHDALPIYDHGQRNLDPGHATYSEYVVVIEGGCLHANHDMALFHYRVGKVRHIFEAFEASLLFQHYSFHRWSAKTRSEEHTSELQSPYDLV